MRKTPETNGLRQMQDSNGIRTSNGMDVSPQAISQAMSLDGTSAASLLAAAQANGNVGDPLTSYQQAMHLIALQNAKNVFPKPQIPMAAVNPPHPLVQAGAVPPPNLPMPVGSVPDHSLPSTRPVLPARLAMPLNQSSLFQLSYVHNNATLPLMMQNMEAQQLHGFTDLIAANQNSLMVGASSASTSIASVDNSPGGESKHSNKRSHGPSMDRYKNRWSESEISNLRAGYARFGKGAAGVEGGKGGGDGDAGSDAGGYRKGDSEQVWEKILRSFEFQGCRTPRDLKDKWRQLKKKEQDDLLGVREEARRLRLLSTGPGSANGNLSSTSNGNSNSGDNGSSTSSSHSLAAANDAAADALDSPAPSSSSPPGNSSSTSTSSPAPPINSSAPDKTSPPPARSSGSPAPSREPGGGSESGASGQEEASEGSGPDRDSGGADGGSEGSEGGESTESLRGQAAAAARAAGLGSVGSWEEGRKRKLEAAEGEEGLALALDLGEASVTAALIRADGSAVEGAMGQRSVHMHPSSFTLNADEYLEALCGCVDDTVAYLRAQKRTQRQRTGNGEAAGRGEAGAGAVKVVGISCFGMSLVGVSGDGQAVTPVYTHADPRNAAFAPELRRKLGQEGLLSVVERRTAPLQGANAPTLLLRLGQAECGGEQAKVHLWQTLSGFILTRLTGRPQPVTLSEASWTGLLDRVEMQWHKGLLSVLNLSPSSLPALCDADELHAGGLAEENVERWPELAHTLWSRGIGEGAAANVGSRCEGARRVCVTMGASAAIRMCVPNRHAALKRRVNGGSPKKGAGAAGADGEAAEVPRGLWSYALNQETTLVGGSLADGASIYQWATRELAGSGEEMAQLEAEASRLAADAHGLTILPFFSGDSGAGYHWDAKATMTGVTLRTTRSEMLRGMLESVALRLKGLFNLLCQMMGDDDDVVEVHASGEALFKSPLWQQILADALEVPIKLDAAAQPASSVGAAVLALRAAGAKAEVKAVQEKVVYPQASGVAAMQVAFERQEALYKRLYKSA